MKINAKTVAGIRLPAGKSDHIAWDDSIPGFGCRIRAGGSRVLIYQYRIGAKQRRLPLGPAVPEAFPAVRERVAELAARVRLGEDPAGQRAEAIQKAAETFAVITGRYLKAREKGLHGEKALKSRSYVEVARHLSKDCKPLHGLHFATITQATIATRLNELRESVGDTTTNRVRASLSAMYGWAARQGIVQSNPVAFTAKSEEVKRERVLEDSEVARIWEASGNDHHGSIVKLLALTGCRRDEIGELAWSEIVTVDVPASNVDGVKLPAFRVKAIKLPGSRTKNRREHIVPLSKQALEIIERQPTRPGHDGKVRDLIFGNGAGGFSGWSNCKARLDKRLQPMPEWHLHDLRRTMSTVMNDRLGVAPHVVEACLNHISTAASGKASVAGVYNRAAYLRERTQALRLWGDHIAAVTGTNVVRLKKRAGRR